MNYQRGILANVPSVACYLTFQQYDSSQVKACLQQLSAMVDGEQIVLGLGKSLLLQLDLAHPHLPNFPAYTSAGINIPSTPADVWLWVRGSERGELLLLSQQLIKTLEAAFHCTQIVDAFCHLGGRDLTGYEDGTENPHDEAAIAAAFVADENPALEGGSVVAVQQWLHHMPSFNRMSNEQQDNVIGRRKDDNEELDDAPESAHVKRTAQESFSPEAFVLRRSMPWSSGVDGGLMFVAFGHSSQAFAAQLRRMVGLEDGIQDALFQFTRPITGAYFWCPPVKDGRVQLAAF